MTCIFTENITLPHVFFKHFASKHQLPGLSVSGTLVENGLIFECSVIAKQICQTTFSTQSYYRGSFRTLSNVWDGAKRRSLNVWKDSEYDSVLFFFFSHRIFVVVLCCIGILWVPVLKDLQGGQLFTYIQAVSSYFSPPIAAVYIIAILWKRSNEKVR